MINQVHSRLFCSLLAVALLLAMGGQTFADWPQFQGPNRDGKVPNAVVKPWPKAGPKVLWTKKLDAGFGGSAIKDGQVFLMDREFGKKDILRVLDLKTGKQLWQFVYDAEGRLPFAGSRATPLVDDKHVVIVGGFGHVHCIDRKTHKPVWTSHFKKFGSNMPRWGYPQSALRYKDKVIVAAMAQDVGLVAFDKATGKVAWKSEGVGGGSYASPMLYTMLGQQGVMFISKLSDGSAGQVSFINPDNGKLIWKYNGYFNKIPIPFQTPVGDDMLFVTGGYSNGSVMLYLEKEGDKVTFKELWRYKVDGSQIHPVIVHEGHIYANFNHNDNLKKGGKDAPGLVCIGLDGKYAWKTSNKPEMNRGGMIMLGDKLLALGGEDGVLHLIDPSPKGYKSLATAKLFDGLKKKGNNIWAPMAYSNGLLIVRSQNEVKCVQIGTPNNLQ